MPGVFFLSIIARFAMHAIHGENGWMMRIANGFPT